jgi:hypothetical protein
LHVTAAALAVGLVVGAPVVARAQIELPGTQPGDLVNWPDLLPDAVCFICHADFSADDSEPWNSWAGSMMANAARDPMFWAAVDIANQDIPGVGEFCIRCHSPRAWLSGRSLPADGSAFVGSPDLPGDFKTGSDFEGVDCHFCHRMYEGEAGTPFRQNGQYWVDDGTPTQEIPGPPMRGPYDDAQPEWHRPLYSPYHRSSEFCAVCHNVRNPLVNLRDETGADTGLLFPEQLTYDEWAQSRFPADGIECQTCHMPAVAGRACAVIELPREEVPQHHLSGANAWMSTVLMNLYGNSLRRNRSFDSAINLALDMLQNQSADLRVNVPSRAAAGDTVDANVVVTNLTGHKLPTGYPEGRRMWLHVLVKDALGTTLFESGRYDDATADLIEDAEIKVYETLHGTHAGGEGFHLVLNDRILKDNRIPPAGFRPDASTMPVGITFETLPDGSLANWDRTGYAFTIPEGTYSPISVTVSLRYQTTSKEYIEFLRDENVTGPDPQDPDPAAPSRGEKMYSAWDDNDRCPPILMKTTTRYVRLDRPPFVSVVAPDPAAPLIRNISRNPFRERTAMEFWTPSRSRVRLALYDVTGRRVRTLVNGDLERDWHRAEWDGSDDHGRAAATGSYFLRLDVAGHAPALKRVLLMR